MSVVGMALAVASCAAPGERASAPSGLPGMHRIEDLGALRPDAGYCLGDCPSAYDSSGPRVDIEYRAEEGRFPDDYFVMSSVQDEFRECLAHWKPEQGAVRGRVVMRAVIDEQGVVRGVTVRANDGLDPALASCMGDRLRERGFGNAGPARILVIAFADRP